MLNTPVFRPTMMALSVAMALTAPLAHAATFEGSVTGDGNNVVASPAAASVAEFVQTSGNRSSSYQGVVATGTSSVSAISDGQFYNTVDSVLTFRQAVTNPFGTTQAVSFDFHIPRSRTIIDLGSLSNLQTFSAASSFTGTISWGGVTVWSARYGVQGSGDISSGGTITGVGPTLSASAGGFTIEPLVVEPPNNQTVLSGSGYIMSNDYQGTLELGTLANGETKDLVYTLSANAHFEATYSVLSSSFEYGYGGYAQAGGFDPFGIEFEPTPNGGGAAVVFTTPVPEPQTYALMLGGLALLATRLRRRQAFTTAPAADTADTPPATTEGAGAVYRPRC